MYQNTFEGNLDSKTYTLAKKIILENDWVQTFFYIYKNKHNL